MKGIGTEFIPAGETGKMSNLTPNLQGTNAPDAMVQTTAAAAMLVDYSHPANSTASPIEVARRAQIDGLRALAMIGVLYVHFWHRNSVTENVRVSLFFVVSGFLITHILYSAKERGGHIHIFNFYIRRMLRLFPALAVLVIVAFVFDMDGFRQSALWHIFQLTNIHYALAEDIKPWVAGHLWSLNVLEQFYLIWPIVILMLPLRRIYGLVIAIAVTMILLRNHGDLLGIHGWWRYMVLATDPVAVGAFFYLLQREPAIAQFIRSWSTLVISLLLLAAPYLLGHDFGATETYRILVQPALCVVVVGAFHGYRGPIGWALGSSAAQFISKISYSIYIYHLAIWWLVAQISPELFRQGPVTFLAMSALTGAVAIVSWYALEEPISRLKTRFPTATRSG